MRSLLFFYRRVLPPVFAMCGLLAVGGCGSVQPSNGANHSPLPKGQMQSPNAQPAAAPTLSKTHSQFESDNDLISQIQSGLALPQYEAAAIEQQIRWHLDNPNYLNRVWQRSQPYLFHVVTEIKQRELPMELALLPIVESGYQPYGYSHARAAGLWQFIPSTGRHFGLRQDWWSDQRRDVIASTDAALTYLEQLNNRFDGDWLLALAAYNAGAGRIERAIRATGKPRNQVHFADLKLNTETTTYVPKLLALAQLIERAEEFNIELPVIADEPYFALVDIGQQTDLGKISQLAGIDTDQLRQLNPALNRWATDPKGPHRVLVPVAAEHQLHLGLEQLSDSERIQWRRHKIAQGESLNSIAKQYGLTVAVLQQSNQLQGNLIRAGKHLLVPSAAALPTPLATSCRGPRLIHQVKSGDTLWDLSQSYGVSVNHLKRCNPGLSAGSLALNSTIRIRDPQPFALAPALPTQARVDQVVNYKVRRGDSLAGISSRFGVSVQQLVSWNQINPKNYLQPGDRLIVKVNLLDRG